MQSTKAPPVVVPAAAKQMPNAGIAEPSDHRRRLLEAMARACATKGFAATTIADLAADARVSKRTFYESFGCKADCFIALYESASANALLVLRGHLAGAADWRTKLLSALSAYFNVLSSNPVLLRSLFIEVLGLGTIGLEARRRVTLQMAQFIVEVVANQNDASTSAHISEMDAMALVGAINELILQAIEQGRADQLAALVDPSARLIHALVDSRDGIGHRVK